MTIDNQIALCSKNYNKWKNIALASTNSFEAHKALKRAFFWLELQTAFILLNIVEQTRGSNREVLKKLILAKANLSKRLAEYAEEILNEIMGKK